MYLDPTFGEGPGLVGAEHVHRTEALDGGQSLDDHLRRAETTRAVREVDGHDGRQELRCEPDRERDGEEKRVERRFVQHDVRSEDHEHQHESHLEKQPSEPPQRPLELRVRRSCGEPGGERSEHGRLTGPKGDGAGRSAHDVGAREESARAGCERRVGRHGVGRLLDRERLAGEQCLVDETIPRVHHPSIRGHDGPRPQEHDVAGNDVLVGQLRASTIAEHASAHLDQGEQASHHVGRAPLLKEAQQAARDYDGEDDGSVRQVTDGG